MASITISTDLLAAVAKWANGDPASPLTAVVFRDGEIVATNGARMIFVPLALCPGSTLDGAALGVRRRDLLAAIAAQNVIARDDIAPELDHDIETNSAGDGVLTDGPYGTREITIRHHDSGHVEIEVSSLVTLKVASANLEQYPSREKMLGNIPAVSDKPPPEGIIFQPLMFAAIEEVTTAAWMRHSGVRCTGWGGLLQPMSFETKNGVRMIVMPMKPNPEVVRG